VVTGTDEEVWGLLQDDKASSMPATHARVNILAIGASYRASTIRPARTHNSVQVTGCFEGALLDEGIAIPRPAAIFKYSTLLRAPLHVGRAQYGEGEHCEEKTAENVTGVFSAWSRSSVPAWRHAVVPRR
jgi:hypothetical protein